MSAPDPSRPIVTDVHGWAVLCWNGTHRGWWFMVGAHTKDHTGIRLYRTRDEARRALRQIHASHAAYVRRYQSMRDAWPYAGAQYRVQRVELSAEVMA